MENSEQEIIPVPAVLCCALERMQKRALSIILPGVSYQEALCQSGLAPLEVHSFTELNFSGKQRRYN